MRRGEPRAGILDRRSAGRGLCAVAFSGALLPLACVGEQDDKPTKEQREELTETICEKRVECCGEFFDETNRDTCRATQGSVVGTYFNRVDAAVDRGNATYNSGTFEDCASALDSASCSTWLGLESGDWPTACRELVRGSLGDGSDCEDHFDCASGWCDEQGVSGAAGTCQPRGQTGDRCGAAAEGCEVGLHCKRTADSDYICAATAGPGEVCSQGSDCDSGACLNDVCVAQCTVNWVAWPS